MRSSPHSGQSHRKIHDRLLVLLLLGVVGLMPPAASIFLVDDTVGGIPVPVVYIFTVWICLIAGCAFLTRKLQKLEETTEMTGNGSDRSSGET